MCTWLILSSPAYPFVLLGHSIRDHQTDKFAASLEAQKLNEDGAPKKTQKSHWKGTSRLSKDKGKAVDVSANDSGSDYSTSEASSQSQSGSEVSTDVEIPNEEVNISSLTELSTLSNWLCNGILACKYATVKDCPIHLDTQGLEETERA